jgi:hypothetical protein
MLRKLIKASCSNVAFRSGTVTGFDAAGMAIRSVSYRVKSGETIAVDATLLVDATGPSAAGQKWLKRSGFEPPRKHFYTRKCLCTRDCWTDSFVASITYLTTTFPTTEELRKIRIPHLSTPWHESGLNLYAAGADPHRGKTTAMLMPFRDYLGQAERLDATGRPSRTIDARDSETTMSG